MRDNLFYQREESDRDLLTRVIGSIEQDSGHCNLLPHKHDALLESIRRQGAQHSGPGGV